MCLGNSEKFANSLVNSTLRFSSSWATEREGGRVGMKGEGIHLLVKCYFLLSPAPRPSVSCLEEGGPTQHLGLLSLKSGH